MRRPHRRLNIKAIRFIGIFAALIGGAALADEPLPPNTIDCSQFKKVNGAWTEVSGGATFDFGKGHFIIGDPITPQYMGIGGFELYYVLEKKCGSPV
jgi:hypothetical protein